MLDWWLGAIGHFELGSFTHLHTHKHYVPSCSGKNLIAVGVKIVHRDLCRSSQNSMHSYFLLFILHSNTCWIKMLHRHASQRLITRRRTLAEADILFNSTRYIVLSIATVLAPLPSMLVMWRRKLQSALYMSSMHSNSFVAFLFLETSQCLYSSRHKKVNLLDRIPFTQMCCGLNGSGLKMPHMS